MCGDGALLDIEVRKQVHLPPVDQLERQLGVHQRRARRRLFGVGVGDGEGGSRGSDGGVEGGGEGGDEFGEGKDGEEAFGLDGAGLRGGLREDGLGRVGLE